MAHRYREFDWYETPLLYDIIFDVETDRECDFLERMVEEHAAPVSARRGRALRVLEPACGSGRLVAEMARRGHAVTGFDISPGALAFARRRMAAARERAGRVRLAQGRMESFRFPGTFDLAHCLVSSFRYLLDEDDARSHLDCVARALRPGGIYVLGLHLAEYGHETVGRERWVAARGDVRVVCNIESRPGDARRRREAMRSRLIATQRQETVRYQTTWLFRTYSARQLRSLLARIPALEHVATYDFDYDADRPRELGAERLDQVLILRRR